MEEFEFQGIWWFPESEDHQVAGTIKFQPMSGTVLEVIGDDFGQINESVDIICGFTNKGDPVTLYKCQEIENTWATGYVGCRYRIQVTFIGCHFTKEEDIVFDGLQIEYFNFQEWLGITGFTDNSRSFWSDTSSPVEVKYARPKRIEIQVNNLNIAFVSWLSPHFDSFDIRLKQSSFIEITPDKPMHYNQYHRQAIYHLRNFLTLGIGAPMLPKNVLGKNLKNTREGTEIPRPNEIFYSPKGASVGNKDNIGSWDMLFRYEDIADNFQRYLQNWFSLAEKLRPVIDIYFGISYIPSIYIHLEFLTLTQALEAYHRHMHGGEYMAKENYQSIEQALNDAIPDEVDNGHRDSLKSRIRYGYQYSLRRRLALILRDILEPYNQIVNKFFEHQAVFIKKLVDTRNYYTHYEEGPDSEPITDTNELYIFVQRMKLLMQLCLFAELELPAATLEKLLSQNHKAQGILRLKG